MVSCFLLGLAFVAYEARSQASPAQAGTPAAQTTPPSAGSPDPTQGFEVAETLEIQTFATEPLIYKPTNLTVDDRGRVWVLEGRNYRQNFLNSRVTAGDRVVILEDTDRNGTADKSTVFYQGADVNAALGIAVLGDKVIVSAYENIFVFTNKDDKPVKKEVFFTSQTQNSDHSTHKFVFGPDGKLYWNAGNSVSRIMDASGKNIVDKSGKEVTSVNFPQGKSFRVNEDGTEFEVIAHNFRNNFELALDSYGSVWQSDNDDDGNASVAINYVMEYGNFGYTDPVTGAAWREPRYDLETTTPKRHWYQNSPGIVPNLLETGAGSPAGIVVYEGTLLPARFRGQMIHAEPGWNVVRAYPVQMAGAGFSAEIVNIVQNQKNQWFRPSDVAVAPDGSLFISDWSDPGVGGHRQGDQTTGRIYRVAPVRTPYRVPQNGFTTIAGAITALRSPNQSVVYRAWHRLHEAGREGESALSGLFAERTAGNAPIRARALWLLSKIPARGDYWVRRGLTDSDVNLRVTAVRAARQLSGDVLPYLDVAVKDAAPQVRREAAIALRHNSAPRAAELWADLALQHDGKDRWYLEALGIGAADQWDRYLAVWQEKAGATWNTPVGRDIVWRSRAKATLGLLGQIILSPSVTSADRPRYFRALDFQDKAGKQELLRSFLTAGTAQNAREISGLALYGLDVDPSNLDPTIRAAVDRALAATDGTQTYLDLVQRFQLKEHAPALVQMALRDAQGTLGQAAARLAIALVDPAPAGGRGGGGGRGAAGPPAAAGAPVSPAGPPAATGPPAAAAGRGAGALGDPASVGGARGAGAGGRGAAAPSPNFPEVAKLFAPALGSAGPLEVRRVLLVLGTADNNSARQILQGVVLDATKPDAVRREAVRTLGMTRAGETAILTMTTGGTLPESLRGAASLVLFSSYTAATREQAAKFLTPPQGLGASGAALPSPGELALRQGDPTAGRAVFQQICATCHRVDGQGVQFAPDLSQIGSKLAKQAIYSKILQPDSGITFGYEGYVLKLKNGNEVTGYIESQTPQQLTIRGMGGISTRYDVSQIDSRQPLPGSLMPSGLAGAMTQKQLIDLVEFLSSRRGIAGAAR